MWGFETKNVVFYVISQINARGNDEGFLVISIIYHNTENV